jgi:AraC-like DNA-binding protein
VSTTPQAEYVLPEVWTTEALPPDRQFDAWRSAIGNAHMKWDIQRAAPERFLARICLHQVDGVRLTDCTASGRVSGTRSAPQIAQDSEAYLNVVMIAEGSAVVRFGSSPDVHLSKGMFALRDTSRPMSFVTSEGNRQMSLLLPEARLLSRMPRVRDLVGRPMDGRHGMGGLFVDHFRMLMPRLSQLPASSRHGVLDTTLDLLTLCLGEQPTLAPPRLRQVLLEQVQRHIETRLTDPTLGPASLARVFGMTERNVHKLFEHVGVTVGAHVRSRRLAMCRRDLECTTLAARQIGEIAGHWGFPDASHFGKVFRAAYGLSPKEFRAQVTSRRA